jgi:hypothetical protein
VTISAGLLVICPLLEGGRSFTRCTQVQACSGRLVVCCGAKQAASHPSFACVLCPSSGAAKPHTPWRMFNVPTISHAFEGNPACRIDSSDLPQLTRRFFSRTRPKYITVCLCIQLLHSHHYNHHPSSAFPQARVQGSQPSLAYV